MTDQNALADKVQKIAAEMRDAMRREEDGYLYADFLSDMSDYIRDLEKICARSRPRPTLADMTPDERAACLRMQCDVVNHTERYVIVNPHDRHREAVLIDDDGGIERLLPEYVTPRPDLPRLEWPGDKKPAPTPTLPDGWRLADHHENGRVIVTNPNPTRDGRVYYVLPSAELLGFDWLFCDPDELTYLDG